MRAVLPMVVALCLAASLTACASRPPPYTPTAAEVEAGDRGPLPDDLEAAIKAYMQSVLKDPESARYRFPVPPQRSFTSKGPAKGDVTYDWRVDAFVNAKNSYGGYVGEHNYSFRIRGGQVVGHFDSTQALNEIDTYLRRR